jgi:hypothetical protein
MEGWKSELTLEAVSSNLRTMLMRLRGGTFIVSGQALHWGGTVELALPVLFVCECTSSTIKYRNETQTFQLATLST